MSRAEVSKSINLWDLAAWKSAWKDGEPCVENAVATMRKNGSSYFAVDGTEGMMLDVPTYKLVCDTLRYLNQQVQKSAGAPSAPPITINIDLDPLAAALAQGAAAIRGVEESIDDTRRALERPRERILERDDEGKPVKVVDQPVAPRRIGFGGDR